MQNIHVLYQLLIPALFLVLWALNQLFNKEASGANRPGAGLGPRPGSPPTPRPRPRPPQTTAYKPEPIGARPAGEDEIKILEPDPRRNLEPDPRRNLEPPRRPSNPPQRQPSRPSRQNRPGQKPAPGKAMGTRTGQPGSLANASNLTSQTTQTTQVTSATADRFSSRADNVLPIGGLPFQLRQSLSDQARLREAMLLQEILQPPVSLRRGRR